MEGAVVGEPGEWVVRRAHGELRPGLGVDHGQPGELRELRQAALGALGEGAGALVGRHHRAPAPGAGADRRPDARAQRPGQPRHPRQVGGGEVVDAGGPARAVDATGGARIGQLEDLLRRAAEARALPRADDAAVGTPLEAHDEAAVGIEDGGDVLGDEPEHLLGRRLCGDGGGHAPQRRLLGLSAGDGLVQLAHLPAGDRQRALHQVAVLVGALVGLADPGEQGAPVVVARRGGGVEAQSAELARQQRVDAVPLRGGLPRLRAHRRPPAAGRTRAATPTGLSARSIRRGYRSR